MRVPLLQSKLPVRSGSLALASDSFTTINTITEFMQEFPILLPVTTTRWRLRVYNNANAGAVAMTAAVLGDPGFNANGSYAASLSNIVQALAAFNTPADGSEYVTPWVTDPALQFQADKMRTIRQGGSCSAGTVLSMSSRRSITYSNPPGSGSSGDLLAATNTHGNWSNQAAFLDIHLDYEFRGDTPVVLVIGDSYSTAYMDALVSNWLGGPSLTWQAQAAMRERFAWIDLAKGGLTTADFTSPTAAQWSRIPASILAQATHVVIALGANDYSASQLALNTFIANLQAVIATAKAKVAPGARFYVGTVWPSASSQNKQGVLTQGYASGVTSVQTSVAYANGDVVDIGKDTVSNFETKTVSGASTGSGPYTTTFTAATTKAHSAGELISNQNESRRRDYNNYLRSGIANVDGIFDFDRELASFSNQHSQDRAFNNGTGHPGHAGYAAMARAARLLK